MKQVLKIPKKIRELYSIVNELEDMFPSRRFTLDGHLIGSIGEILTESHYGLTLLSASTETHDAMSACGKYVQIKATQGKTIGIRSEPQHLLVLKILKNGEYKTVHNGPGGLAWRNAGKMQKNGQRSISVSKLESLLNQVKDSEKLIERVK